MAIRSRKAEDRNTRLRARTGPPLLSEDLFRGVLLRERKRADRSNQPLALALVSVLSESTIAARPIWPAVVEAVNAAKRETDVVGWFETDLVMGIVLPEIPPGFPRELHDRICLELSRRLNGQSRSHISIRLHVHGGPGAADGEGFQPVDHVIDRGCAGEPRPTGYDVAKRTLDVGLSVAFLTAFLPLFLLIAAVVKLTSRGPVLFKQERVGQMMKPFMMLKFRTMHTNADHAIHHQFVSAFIKSRGRLDSGKPELFKIVNDPRVTPIGRFLRRTSLDEIPQFWNVLRGDMSLVGPRPPLAYEVEQYKPWHLRRILEAKPGVTGLWQVTGRSQTTFDEMVRLDLRYARSNSVWTDIKILLATPRAVITGRGAC